MFKNFQREQSQKTGTDRWLELRLKETIWADAERRCAGNVTETVKISNEGAKRGQSGGWICSSTDCKTWNQHRSWTADADSLSSREAGLFFFFSLFKMWPKSLRCSQKERRFKNSKKHIVVLLVRMRWQARKGESHKRRLKTHKSAYILHGLYQ